MNAACDARVLNKDYVLRREGVTAMLVKTQLQTVCKSLQTCYTSECVGITLQTITQFELNICKPDQLITNNLCLPKSISCGWNLELVRLQTSVSCRGTSGCFLRIILI